MRNNSTSTHSIHRKSFSYNLSQFPSRGDSMTINYVVAIRRDEYVHNDRVCNIQFLNKMSDPSDSKTWINQKKQQVHSVRQLGTYYD